MLRVNIYYGGRGLIEDSTIYVMNKLTEVLSELNVEVKRYNLYEDRQGISILPKTLKEADGIIFAASVEWFGIGGFLQQFLDACWLYGDKEKIRSLYMMPVAISTTIGEKEALSTLCRAWDILGGITCDGISAYVADHADFETNPDYVYLIEKRTENFYRTFSKKMMTFPTSTKIISENVLQPKTLHLTPQESEQLSVYVSDSNYVQKQKEDIEELTSMFRGMLGDTEETEEPPSFAPKAEPTDAYIAALTSAFTPIPNLNTSFSIQIQETGKILLIQVQGTSLNCTYTENLTANVMTKTTEKVLRHILSGNITFQKAFRAGAITAKGDFQALHTFDTLFPFKKENK